jgi:hypothetical protein
VPARYRYEVPTFSDDIVAAVLHHMNDDHPDDSLLIARAFAHPDATESTMSALDGHGGTWVYTVGNEQRDVIVPWTTEISERAEIRREIVVLYDRACKTLGLEPRPH